MQEGEREGVKGRGREGKEKRGERARGREGGGDEERERGRRR